MSKKAEIQLTITVPDEKALKRLRKELLDEDQWPDGMKIKHLRRDTEGSE